MPRWPWRPTCLRFRSAAIPGEKSRGQTLRAASEQGAKGVARSELRSIPRYSLRSEPRLVASEQLPFQLQFFHPGFIYNKTVQIAEIDRGEVKPIEFSQRLFDYGKARSVGRVPSDMGFTDFGCITRLTPPTTSTNWLFFKERAIFAHWVRRCVMASRREGWRSTPPRRARRVSGFEEFWWRSPA